MAEPKSTYQRRKESGLCVKSKCNEKPVPGKVMCEKHMKESAERSARQRDARRAKGLCLVAGCNRQAESAGGRCRVHLDQGAAIRRSEIAKWDAEGKCVSCGGRHGERMPGCKLCEHCSHARSVVSSRHYARRKLEGHCAYGNHPPLPGESMCAYHKQLYADYRERVKLETMTHYGNGEAACAECGNNVLAELDLHHVDGGGNQHRRENGFEGSGHGWYLWLRSHAYPPGLNVLCAGCHRRAHVQEKQEAQT